MRRKQIYRKVHVKLRRKDKRELKSLLSHGINSVRVCKRAQILILLSQKMSAAQAGAAIGVSAKTARQIGFRYEDGGLKEALFERDRPGQTPIIGEKEGQEIIAMVCSDPPKGRDRWSMVLIAEEAVHRKIVPRTSRETVRLLLKRHDLKPWREKNVVHWSAHRGVHPKDGGFAQSV